MIDLKVSLIIPAYNEEKYIVDCLDHTIKNSNSRFYEIIVVDNGSTDKTKEVVERYPNVRLISEKNKGLTRARQRGFEEATGDILAYIDADTRISANWYDTVVEEFNSNPLLACLSGPYIFYDASLVRNFITKLYWYAAKPTYWLVGYMACGGNIAIKRTVLEKMKGFDTSIEFYGEDTNIARRAKEFGKVKFELSHYVNTSARRLNSEGWMKTGIEYIKNFFSEVFLKRPRTNTYNDIR